jgi:hypothetical protein
MAEWMILVLLVPAIVVPVAMLVGFAGCQLVWGVDEYQDGPTGPPEVPDPVIDSAKGKSACVITLNWTYNNPAVVKFQIERDGVVQQEEPPSPRSTTPAS